MRVLITRALPEATRTARLLHRCGATCDMAPMSKIIFRESARVPDLSYGAVVVTSRNGVRALERHMQRTHDWRFLRCPLYGVGDKTALLARQAGFDHVRSASGNAHDLSRMIIRECGADIAPILYMAAAERTPTLEAELNKAGINVVAITAYDSVPTNALPPGVFQALKQGQYDAALYYSKSAAVRFCQLKNITDCMSGLEATRFFCLSSTIARVFVAKGLAVTVAPEPNERALLLALKRYSYALRDDKRSRSHGT